MSLFERRTWVREGYSRWTEPETWNYQTAIGSIYAKVRQDELRKWIWYTMGATSTGFEDFETAKSNAEAYLRTHPDLLPLNH